MVMAKLSFVGRLSVLDYSPSGQRKRCSAIKPLSRLRGNYELWRWLLKPKYWVIGMYRFAVAGVVCTFLLAGCGPSVDEPKRPLVWRAPPIHEQSIGLAAIRAKMAPEAIGEAPFQARLASQQGQGTPEQRYTLHSRARLMQLEGDLFVVLAKLGYTRKGVKQSAGRFVVDYVHPHDVTISADYADYTGKGEDDGAKSRVILSWKLSG